MAWNGSAYQAHVLVVDDVDDDNEARQLLAQVLQSQGYDVVQAENGESALERALLVSPHLILLDLNMPVMDGWEFLRWLARQSGIKPAVIVITAQIPGAIPGASAVLRKPVDVPYLLDLIRQLLAKSGSVDR
jgi:CheY-like chemotaxis protein